MNAIVVLGAQWGDEGKGKIVDILSCDCDVVARFQGGANAGHTVIVKDEKYILHLIPSGILHDKVTCVIGNGVVLDPIAFFEEIEFLNGLNIDTDGRIFILPNTQIIMPYHRLIDNLSEHKDQKIGTTGRGIGPAYTDKSARLGIQAIDFFDEEILRFKVANSIKQKNVLLKNYYEQESINFDSAICEAMDLAERIKPYVLKDSLFVNNAIAQGRRVLIEGAQGALLDVDHGNYPFVTSSNPTIGGALTGLGISPKAIGETIAIVKSYATRVGEGPFPTEQKNEIGEQLRKIGSEFGATTGRPRRCGWLDLISLRYSTQINGYDSIAITKLDVLSEFSELKICTSYKLNGIVLDYFPIDYKTLEKVEPVYSVLPGWKLNVRGISNYDELPIEAKKYLSFIEEFLNVPIRIVSTGSERSETIFVNDN
ncbi:MAG: adenylosuccinate synthase [Ignavibacteria bacterium]|nr:adenylosuccinate synthase [Ignavibacteria bacterium]